MVRNGCPFLGNWLNVQPMGKTSLRSVLATSSDVDMTGIKLFLVTPSGLDETFSCQSGSVAGDAGIIWPSMYEPIRNGSCMRFYRGSGT